MAAGGNTVVVAMRVSDEDRRRVVDELRRHCGAGRIDVEEYSARIERVLSATTFEELDVVRADLPMLRIAEPAGRGPTAADSGHAGGTGRRSLLRRGAFGDGISARTRLSALGVAVITAVVVLTALIVALVAEWTWAVLLLAGWAAGMLQGRLGRRHGS